MNVSTDMKLLLNKGVRTSTCTPFLLDFIQIVDKNMTKNVYFTFNSFLQNDAEITQTRANFLQENCNCRTLPTKGIL